MMSLVYIFLSHSFIIPRCCAVLRVCVRVVFPFFPSFAFGVHYSVLPAFVPVDVSTPRKLKIGFVRSRYFKRKNAYSPLHSVTVWRAFALHSHATLPTRSSISAIYECNLPHDIRAHSSTEANGTSFSSVFTVVVQTSSSVSNACSSFFFFLHQIFICTLMRTHFTE